MSRKAVVDGTALQEILATLPEVVAVVGRGGEVLYVNRGKGSEGEAGGEGARDLEALLTSPAGEPFDGRLRPVFERGAAVEWEERVGEGGDGAVRRYRIRAHPLRRDGAIGRAVLRMVPTGDPREWPSPGVATGGRYRRLAETVPHVLFALDADGRLVEVNRAGEALLGQARSELVGRPVRNWILDEDLPRAERCFQAVRARGTKVAEAELRVRRRSGELRFVHAILTGAPVEEGAEARVVGTARDVTEEVEGREQRSRLLFLAEASPGLIATAGRDGRLVYLNPAGRRLAGLDPRASLAGWDLLDLYPPESARRIREEALPVSEAEGMWTGEVSVRNREGAEVPVWQVLLAHRAEAGEPTHYSAVAEDLTQWKRAESALKERVKELRTLYGAQRELARSDVALEERLARIVRSLPAGWLHPDWTEARIVVGDHRFETAGFRETPWMLRAEIAGESGAAGRVEVAATRKLPERDLDPFLLEKSDLVEGLALAVGEALERGRLERKSVQAQKMEAVGRLAGGIAHDFNNLLTVVQGASQMMLEDLPPESPYRKELAQVLRAVRRGTRLTRRLLAFSRRQILEERVVDLRGVVVDIVPLLRRSIPERIGLDVRPGDRELPIRADPGELREVILNLAVNASEAIGGSGSIRLELEGRAVRGGEPERTEGGGPVTASHAVLVVRDTGEGMPPEVQERAFEPFFTTKPDRTGLGLSMVFGVIRQSGGDVRLESEPGKGSAFEVVLPLVGSGEEEAPPPAPGGAAGEEREVRVLLVEDDPAVSSVAVRILERSGYRLRAAGNGLEALEIFQEDPDAFDVVVSDVVMPKMDGAELIERLLELRPDLKIVVVSGYSDKELAGGVLKRASVYLDKPFSPEELALAIRRALEG